MSLLHCAAYASTDFSSRARDRLSDKPDNSEEAWRADASLYSKGITINKKCYMVLMHGKKQGFSVVCKECLHWRTFTGTAAGLSDLLSVPGGLCMGA